MAYIATKATYIDEEEVKDDNNNVLQRRIITDVDDVVFNTGEVIVLLEEENKDKHFDLTIEDKGSKYFKPTQIKIGDGFHAFKELNWLQTFDPSRMESVVSDGVTAAASTIMGKFTDLENTVNNFIEVDAGKILQELVKGRYFTLSDDVVLSCFNTEGVSDNELKSFSIGYNNNFNYKGKGKRSIIFGEKNSLSGFYDYINGSSNKIEKGNGDFIHGAGNTIRTDSNNNKVYNICFGLWNTISDGDHNFTCGISNEIYQTKGYSNIFNTSFGKNNKISGNYNFIYGYGNNAIACDYSCCLGETNKVIGQHGFAGGRNSYASDYSIAYGDDINAKLKSQSIAPGKYSVSFGRSNNTKGESSFSCGDSNNSNGNYSFSCGLGNHSGGSYSFSYGLGNYSSGGYSFSCGGSNSSIGDYSVSCGNGNESIGNYSFTYGLGNQSKVDYSFSCGRFNNGEDKIFSVGNGYLKDNKQMRSNAFDIDTSGKATFYGDLEVKGEIIGKINTSLSNFDNMLSIGSPYLISNGEGVCELHVKKGIYKFGAFSDYINEAYISYNVVNDNIGPVTLYEYFSNEYKNISFDKDRDVTIHIRLIDTESHTINLYTEYLGENNNEA